MENCNRSPRRRRPPPERAPTPQLHRRQRRSRGCTMRTPIPMQTPRRPRRSRRRAATRRAPTPTPLLKCSPFKRVSSVSPSSSSAEFPPSFLPSFLPSLVLPEMSFPPSPEIPGRQLTTSGCACSRGVRQADDAWGKISTSFKMLILDQNCACTVNFM